MFGIGKKKKLNINLTESVISAINIAQKVLEVYHGFQITFKSHLEICSEIVNEEVRQVCLSGQVSLPNDCEQNTPTHFSLRVDLLRVDEPRRWKCTHVMCFHLYTPNVNQKLQPTVQVTCAINVTDDMLFEIAEYMNSTRHLEFTKIIGHDLSDRHIESVLPPKFPSKRG